MIYLLDTNICIAILKKEEVVLKLMNQLPNGSVKLPSVVVAELSFGARKSQDPGKSLALLAVLTSEIQTVDFDFHAAHHYGQIRAIMQRGGTPIGPNDYLIAATALSQDATLITRNIGEFSRIPGLRWQTV